MSFPFRLCLPFTGGLQVNATVDGPNLGHAYDRDIGGRGSFNLAAFPQAASDLKRIYNLKPVIMAPFHYFWPGRIRDTSLREVIQAMINEEELLPLHCEGRGKDDRHMLLWAYRTGSKIVSNDLRLHEHLEDLSQEERSKAQEWLKKSQLTYKFIKGRLVLNEMLPVSD